MAYGDYSNDELEKMSEAELLNALHVGRNVDRRVMNDLKDKRPDLLMEYMSDPNVRVPSELKGWMEEQSGIG